MLFLSKKLYGYFWYPNPVKPSVNCSGCCVGTAMIACIVSISVRQLEQLVRQLNWCERAAQARWWSLPYLRNGAIKPNEGSAFYAVQVAKYIR